MKRPLLHRSAIYFNCLLLFLGFALTTGLASAAATNVFEKDIVAFENQDRTNPPPRGTILFVGDSQFTRWKTIHEDLAGYNLINRGFGGSRMSDLILYTQRIVTPYHPRLIIVNEGGNDIHEGQTPETLLNNMKTFVAQVREELPGVPIAFTGLAPSPARISESDVRKRFNELLKNYVSSEKNILYIDLFDSYLGLDGKPREELFVADKLHHSAEGYKVRVKVMRPILGKPDRTD
ncbi:MAG: Argininosuccinate lyase [Verrucomicrobiales bacterium]|nr:Argininosuccinate lyase [Verrucomicrobiales bacterium]